MYRKTYYRIMGDIRNNKLSSLNELEAKVKNLPLWTGDAEQILDADIEVIEKYVKSVIRQMKLEKRIRL